MNTSKDYGQLYPVVMLGDGQWDRVIKALRQRDTKADAALADRIERDVEATRDRARARAEVELP